MFYRFLFRVVLNRLRSTLARRKPGPVLRVAFVLLSSHTEKHQVSGMQNNTKRGWLGF